MTRRTQTSRRARRRLEVRYGPEAPQFIGYSGNVSRTGIMIRCVRLFAPGTLLNLELKFPDGTFKVRGEVMWARDGSVLLLSTGRIGMGVNFLDPSVELLAYLDRMSGTR